MEPDDKDWLKVILLLALFLYSTGHGIRDFVFWDWNWPLSSMGYRICAVLSLLAPLIWWVNLTYEDEMNRKADAAGRAKQEEGR